MKLQAVFLDREGIITPKLARGEYLLTSEQAILGSGVDIALRELLSLVPRLFIVSNQSCVGKGLLSSQAAADLHTSILVRLASEGIEITDSLICEHVTEDECSCRKPKPGMIQSLCASYDLDPAMTVMIGDSLTDVQAGEAAGCALNILVNGEAKISTSDVDVCSVQSLSEAVTLLVNTYR